MGLFAERVRCWLGRAADWLGFSVRRVLTTNPPPIAHKQEPRINRDWRHAWTDPDEETTPDLRKRKRHARPRPPPIKRGDS